MLPFDFECIHSLNVNTNSQYFIALPLLFLIFVADVITVDVVAVVLGVVWRQYKALIGVTNSFRMP